MTQTPLVTIIVPTWNGEQYIEDCLQSVINQDYPKIEIIVVDNASEDHTVDRVVEQFPMVTLIRNQQNMGFAGGINIGLQAAQGNVLILFNQDAVAHPGWLQALVSGIYSAPDVGIAGCKVLDFEAPAIQHAGGYLTMPLALSSHFGLGETDEGQYEELKDVDFVTGAAMAIRREVVEKVGYLDETLFFYFEDVDYCYQARKAGFRVIYVPSAVLRHQGNASLGVETVDHFRRFHASRLCFVLKHWGVDYFVSTLYPAERDRLDIVSPKEQIGLRHAYQIALEHVIQTRQNLSLDAEALAKLFSIVRDLRQHIRVIPWEPAPYSTETSMPIQTLPDSWWNVKEQPFISKTPFIGSLVAWFRTKWNNISTRWFVRAIVEQQNEVNWRLVQSLEILLLKSEMQDQIINKQNRILSNFANLLTDFDDDQTRLTIQLGEILYRLDEIEAHAIKKE